MIDLEKAKQLKRNIAKQRRKIHRAWFYLLTPILRILTRNLVFSNDVSSKQDGAGAQIQRMLAVASLAHYLRIPFQQSEIKEVAIHPLDPYQTEKEYLLFLKRLNHLVHIDGKCNFDVCHGINHISGISITNLILLGLKSTVIRKNICLNIVSPYVLSDHIPDSYLEIRKSLSNFYRNQKMNDAENTLVIHYRHGVGGKAIYPGQRLARELDEVYFTELVDGHIFLDLSKTKCIVLTDAPESDLDFKVPKSQSYLWEKSPNYNDGIMHIQGNSFPTFRQKFSNLQIIRGGDPIEALLIMSQADFLILSRSSLSYLGGILNHKGQVFPAKGFWHPSLSNWALTS